MRSPARSEGLIVAFVRITWFLNIIASLIYSVVASVFYSSLIQPNPADLTKFWFRLFITTVYWTITFITCLGLLVFFYYQGRKALERKTNKDTEETTGLS